MYIIPSLVILTVSGSLYRGIVILKQEILVGEMSCDYRSQIIFQDFNVLVSVYSTIHSCYSSHTMPGYATPNHYTDLLWAWGHTQSGNSASSLRRHIKILWFSPKSTWLSSENITLSDWPFIFHLILPLHQFSLFLRFTSLFLQNTICSIIANMRDNYVNKELKLCCILIYISRILTKTNRMLTLIHRMLT